MTLTFGNGDAIPMIGLGTWPMDDAECERVVAEAIDLGYRLIDTAFAYGNEIGVGRGVRASSVPRDDVFVTTKFNKEWHGGAGVNEAFEMAAGKLGFDHLDLFLIHWPVPSQDRYVEAWEGLIALREEGKVRHIGTSNFLPEFIDRLVAETGVTPEFNQLQVNPRMRQAAALEYDAAHGILTQAWSPLGQGNDLLDVPVLRDVAERHGCTPGQAVLAWDVAHGIGAVPKSSNPERMVQNLAAERIVLDPADVLLLDSLDGTEPDPMEKNPYVFGH